MLMRWSRLFALTEATRQASSQRERGQQREIDLHPTCFSVFDNDDNSICDDTDDIANHDKENNDNNNNHHNDNNNGKSERRGQQREIDLPPALQPG